MGTSHAAMRLTSIEYSFHPYITFTAIVPGAYQGGQNVPNRRIWHIAANISLLIYYTAIYIQLENKEVNRKVTFGYLIS